MGLRNPSAAGFKFRLSLSNHNLNGAGKRAALVSNFDFRYQTTTLSLALSLRPWFQISTFVIKPQLYVRRIPSVSRFKFRLSLSNHNSRQGKCRCSSVSNFDFRYQTTTNHGCLLSARSFQISTFVIKPQPRPTPWIATARFKFRLSLSNHNWSLPSWVSSRVSNFDFRYQTTTVHPMSFSKVSFKFRLSLSNHNAKGGGRRGVGVSNFDFRYQTTTRGGGGLAGPVFQISTFVIKPQQLRRR